MEMNYTRQHEVFDNSRATDTVHIIGCGATGSWVGLSLARLGVKEIHLYDFDEVENHNLPNQAFSFDEIGMNKAEALAQTIKRTNPEVQVVAHNERVSNKVFTGYVFMLVDSMAARKQIYESSLRFKPAVKGVIETRMDAFIGTVYTVNPTNPVHIKEYAQTLHSDETAVVSLCGVAQSLAPTAAILANLAVWQYMKLIMPDKFECLQNDISVDLKFGSLFGNVWQ